MRKGKFISLDGPDGTGKATQTELLANRLRAEGYEVFVEDFPQYGQPSALMVEQYLNGVFGPAKELGPFVPSIFYATDRFAAKPRIIENLSKSSGGRIIVISNRYVCASMAHQGGKIDDATKRDDFYKWLFDLEFKIFGIPGPDLNLILSLPSGESQKLVDMKGDRIYTKKKRDIHEADAEHLEAARRVYIEISQKFGYPLIDCYRDGRILSRDEVAKLIWQEVVKLL